MVKEGKQRILKMVMQLKNKFLKMVMIYLPLKPHRCELILKGLDL